MSRLSRLTGARKVSKGVRELLLLLIEGFRAHKYSSVKYLDLTEARNFAMNKKLQDLYNTLRLLSPKLCMNPWGVSASETASLASPPVGESRVKKMKKSTKECSLCGASMRPGTCSLVFEYEPNEDFDELVATNLVPACNLCTSVIDLPSLISLIAEVTAKADNQTQKSQLIEIASHFLKVNGHDASESQTFQNALSLATALLVNCRGIPVTKVCLKLDH